MTTMAERRAAAAARIKALTAEATPAPAPATPAKPRLRVRMGAIVTEAMIRMALGVKQLKEWAKSRAEQHVAGHACPHCGGSGRYRFHTDASRNEKCFRCDGKGQLNAKDLAYFERRLGGKGPICWTVSATAA
jgi:hypothetical protein